MAKARASIKELIARRDKIGASNPIARQMLDIQIARARSRESGKTVKLDRRDRDVVYKSKSGEWRKRVAGSRRSVKAKAPQGKYRDDKGTWRDARRKHVKTEAPIQFRELKAPKLKSDKFDVRAIALIAEHLEEHTPNLWELVHLDPIETRRAANPYAKTGRAPGLVIGWRTRFQYEAIGKPATVFSEARAALLAMRHEDRISKAFSGRRSMVRCYFRTADGTETWNTLSVASQWLNALWQSAGKCAEYDRLYTTRDRSGDPIREQSHVIVIIRWNVE